MNKNSPKYTSPKIIKQSRSYIFDDEKVPLPTVEYLETTGEVIAELRKNITGEVVRLSQANVKTDKLITLLLRLRNEWSNRIVSGVSLDDLLEYLEDIHAYMPLLSQSEREKIAQNMDIRNADNFGYDAIVQMGIAPESLISSILQYPSKKSKIQSGENTEEMDNSTFAAYVLSCNIAERFFQKLRLLKNKDTIHESKEHLVEAFNIFNIYWYSPSVQRAIRNISPHTIANLLLAGYNDLKNILDSFIIIGEKPTKLEKLENGKIIITDIDVIGVDQNSYARQTNAMVTSVKAGMNLYVKLVNDVKDHVPHPSVLIGPASAWTIADDTVFHSTLR